jgi:type IV secretory pathway TraG/TraD family ATPase VirD4
MRLVVTALVLLLILAIIVKALIWAFIPHRVLPGNRVRHNRMRLRFRLHPGRGHATVFELWLRWGRLAALRRSGRSRRSMSLWQRIRAGWRAYSVLIGRAHYRHGVRIPLEEHALVMAPPRTGKTGWLARVILHYPGPVVSTTTKADVFELTSGVRSTGGRPVHVFNPQGIGHVPSTFTWNPVEGCQDPAVAIRRADGFAYAVNMEGTEDASFWISKASDYLRALFCAAGLAGWDMAVVAEWVFGENTAEAERILANHGHVQWATQLAELRGDAQKTAATVRMTMTRALSFMTDPALAASVVPAGGAAALAGLDIREFLRDRGTLYLIADSAGDDSPLAPLFACLAGEIHHTAALIGSRSPGGRLDPPMLMALDEIVQTCPVPLPTWLADSGGKGIQLFPVAHGEAQLRTRWKKEGAQVVMDTCGVKIWLPGITDPDTLEMASKLCGRAAYKERGQEHHSRHEVMTPEMIRGLPDRFALVIRGGLSPVVVRLPVAWKDRTYRRARRAGTAVADLSRAVYEPQSLPEPEPLQAEPEPEARQPQPVPDDGTSGQPEFPWTRRPQ